MRSSTISSFLFIPYSICRASSFLESLSRSASARAQPTIHSVSSYTEPISESSDGLIVHGTGGFDEETITNTSTVDVDLVVNVSDGKHSSVTLTKSFFSLHTGPIMTFETTAKRSTSPTDASASDTNTGTSNSIFLSQEKPAKTASTPDHLNPRDGGMATYQTATPDPAPSPGLESLANSKSTESELILSTTKSTKDIPFRPPRDTGAMFDSPITTTLMQNLQGRDGFSDFDVRSTAAPVVAGTKSAEAEVSSAEASVGSAAIEKRQTRIDSPKSGAGARSAPFLAWPLLLVVLLGLHAVPGIFALPNTSSPSGSAPTPASVAASTPSHTASPAVPPTAPPVSPAASKPAVPPRPSSSASTFGAPLQVSSTAPPSPPPPSQTDSPSPQSAQDSPAGQDAFASIWTDICFANQSHGQWGWFAAICGQPVGSRPSAAGPDPHVVQLTLPDFRSSNPAVPRNEVLLAVWALLCTLNSQHDTWEVFGRYCNPPDGDRPPENSDPLEFGEQR